MRDLGLQRAQRLGQNNEVKTSGAQGSALDTDTGTHRRVAKLLPRDSRRNEEASASII